MPTKTENTKIEWTATLLPETVTEKDRQWLERELKLAVFPDETRPGRWLVGGYTHNPWWGCTKWAEGCHHCYAESFVGVWQCRWFFERWNATPSRHLLELLDPIF